MSFNNRIGVTQQVMLNLNPAEMASGPSVETAYGYWGRTSSFVAVATAVCDMPGHIATYLYIDSDGGLHGGHSKTMIRYFEPFQHKGIADNRLPLRCGRT